MSISTIITLLFSSLRLGSIVALAALGIVLIFLRWLVLYKRFKENA